MMTLPTKMIKVLLAMIACGLWPVASFGSRDLMVYHGEPIPPAVEAVYARGLAWLVASQNQDGSWPGQYGNAPGVVGTAVLAMLARGDDPNHGPYSPHIRKGLDYILARTDPQTGYIGDSMYNHGFATLALAEAYGTVNDPRLGPALNKAVALILSAQAANPTGGWRYSPSSRDADTTVSGAQMMALLAARNAGIDVPDRAINLAIQLISRHQSGDGGFGYASASGTTPASSAIGALMLAMTQNNRGSAYKSALRYVEQVWLNAGQHQYYYLYYASQALFHGNMQSWNRWNGENLAWLTSRQAVDGRWTGSEGDVFCTSAALLSLALNYRYLPVYER
jgi:hypothetical protein